jgi:hypothetical protein
MASREWRGQRALRIPAIPFRRAPAIPARCGRRCPRAASPRVARHDTEVPGAVEGDGDAAGGDEAAVLAKDER